MNGSEYNAIPFDVEEISASLNDWLDANMQGLLEGALLGEWFYASDDILAQADTEESHTDAIFTKYKEIEVKKPLRSDTVLRIKFDMHGEGAGKVAYGRIYKNSVAIGTERSRQYLTYDTFEEDLGDITDQGDLIQLYGYITGGGTGYWRNFRICGKTETFIIIED